jgi:cardiolipin synthase
MDVAAASPSLERPPRRWDEIDVYDDGDAFYEALIGAVAGATDTVDIEYYIFATDPVGFPVMEALGAAAARGVRVRLLVDGIGSSTWTRILRQLAQKTGILFKVYHELPWERWWRGKFPSRALMRIRSILIRMNRRNHRKVCIIDGSEAFVGSFNIIQNHSRSCVGALAWRDTGVRIRGVDVNVLAKGFEEIWIGSLRRLRRRLRFRRVQSSDLVKLNAQRKQRQQNYLDLLLRIRNAQQRVWITNAYFIPDGSLLRALTAAAERGVDVRVLVPHFSDVFFMPWISSAFHLGLLKAGVRVFEYTKSILHAKTVVIDDWALVGSSNLNHRSLLHDLEADIVVPNPEAIDTLKRQYLDDLANTAEVLLSNWKHRPILERVVGRLLLSFRFVL